MAQKKDSSGRAFLSTGVKTYKDLIKRSKKINSTTRNVFLVVMLMFGTMVLTKNIVQAEQSGGSPESGATSRLKLLHDDLLALSYGSDTDSPDWGSLWNRIKTSAKWVPSGDVIANDVRTGKTFYGVSRSQQTGTYYSPGVCSTQQYQDSHASANQTNNCTSNYTWTIPAPAVTGDNKKDPQTGLVWSLPLYNNSGTVEFNAISNTTWSWDASAASNIAVGGKTALQLCSERGNGWRLPTQKEMMQAYIDGAYFNLTLTTNVYFWSATEYSATSVWAMLFSDGYMRSGYTKPALEYVRCVRLP